MKITDVTKKRFLQTLKDPRRRAILDAITDVRQRVKHMYMEVVGRPKIRKNRKMNIDRVTIEVQLPGHTPLERMSYKSYAEDVMYTSFVNKFHIDYAHDETEYDELANTLTISAWLPAP